MGLIKYVFTNVGLVSKFLIIVLIYAFCELHIKTPPASIVDISIDAVIAIILFPLFVAGSLGRKEVDNDINQAANDLIKGIKSMIKKNKEDKV